MILWGRSSDKANERIWHVALPAAVAVAGLLVASLESSNLVVFLALCIVLVCLLALQGPFWALPSTFLGGTAAAGAFALINCVGNLSGFVGPGLMGWLLQSTGSYTVGMWMCTGVALVAALA